MLVSGLDDDVLGLVSTLCYLKNLLASFPTLYADWTFCLYSLLTLWCLSNPCSACPNRRGFRCCLAPWTLHPCCCRLVAHSYVLVGALVPLLLPCLPVSSFSCLATHINLCCRTMSRACRRGISMDERNGLWPHIRVLPLSTFVNGLFFLFLFFFVFFRTYCRRSLYPTDYGYGAMAPVIHVIILVLTESYPYRLPPMSILDCLRVHSS
jgi:hypothetical protein